VLLAHAGGVKPLFAGRLEATRGTRHLMDHMCGLPFGLPFPVFAVRDTSTRSLYLLVAQDEGDRYRVTPWRLDGDTVTPLAALAGAIFAPKF